MSVSNTQSRLFQLMAERIPDKIVYRTSVTQSVPLAGGITAYTEYTIPHGLPFIPLVIGSYSFDNFDTSYDFGTGPFEFLPTYSFYSFSVLAHAYADATNITIRVISHNTARDITFHVVGMSKALVGAEATVATPPVQDALLFSSDLNTMKHVLHTEKIMTTNGLGTYVTHTYNIDTDTPLTPMCFVEEGGKRSFMNTMNTITTSGVGFATLSKPGEFTIGVNDTIVSTVTIIVKAYIDA